MNAQIVERVAEALAAERVPFVVIGSFALSLIAPERLSRPPRDLDLLLPFERGALEGFVRASGRLGLSVSSWGEPASLPLNLGSLTGRFYLRAGPEPTVDATYECPWLPWEEALARSVPCGSLQVASLPDLLRLLAARGRPEDRGQLQR